MIRSEFKQLLVILLSALTILSIFFPKMLVQPNRFLFGAEGDGLKNYFTPAWYVGHDKGDHFTGLNYPYGEQVTYTDNQPSISYIINFIDDNIISISDYTIGILNSLFFLSIIGCIYFLYFILRKFSLPPWYATIFALLIGFMSPQLTRSTAHYSLSYAIYIPMLWYGLLLFMERRQIFINGPLLILLISFFGFIHLYYLLIGSFFVLGYAFIWIIPRLKNFRYWAKRFIFLLLIGVVPVIIVQLTLNWGNTVFDRPSTPFGFFHYNAEIQSVFQPLYGPIAYGIKKYLFITEINGEGHAYVGLVAVAVLLFTILRIFIKIYRRRWSNVLKIVSSKRMTTAVWAGTLVLLFSMAIPFKWNLQFLLDFVPQLKQFRSIGRFAWVFYYVFTVYTAYYCYLWIRYFQIQQKTWVSALILILTLPLWSYECYWNMKHVTRFEVRLDTFFKGNDLGLKAKLEKEGYNIAEFQAILALPYFHIGSEKTSIIRYWRTWDVAAKSSFDLGLPLMNVMMSRTSSSQTMKQLQLLSSNLIEKELISDLPNEKPLLLIVVDDKSYKDEERLIKKSRFILKHNNMKIYELPLKGFKANTKRALEIYDIKKDSSLFEFNDLQLTRKTNTVVQDQLLGSGPEFLGKSRKFEKSGPMELFNGTLPLDTLNGRYEASIWIHVNPDFSGFPAFTYKRTDKDSNELETKEVLASRAVNYFKGWLRLSLEFDDPQPGDNLHFKLEGSGIGAANFLLKPLNTTVFKPMKKDGYLMMNNYYVPIEKE